MKLTLSLLAAAGSLSFNANAATFDWDTHAALQTGAAMTPVGSFADTYLFNLSSAVALTSSAVSNNLGSVLAGSDYDVVSGAGTGTMGGFYALASAHETAVSVVPEPSALALMLAGLGIVSLKGHRRLRPKS